MNHIEAMKQALEALEDVRIEYDFHGNPLYDEDKKIDPAITVLRQAIELAEKREPVAYRYRVMSKMSSGPCWTFVLPQPEGILETQPLYAAPPKREWVGLTDEEILEAAGIDGADTWVFETAYAIEAKLKDKNT